MKNLSLNRKILFAALSVVFLITLIRLIYVEIELAKIKRVEVSSVDASSKEILPDDEVRDESVDEEKPDLEAIDEKPAEQIEIEPEKELLSFSIPVTANFYNTFRDSEEIKKLAQKTGNNRLHKLLSAHISRNLVFSLDMRKDIYPKDHVSAVFRIVPEKERREREDLPDVIEILALTYKSTKKGKTFKFYSFKSASKKFPAFFDEFGFAIEKPLKNFVLKDWIQITSVLKDRRPKHDGIDFKAPAGTPIYAPWSGRVLRTNWNKKYNGLSIEAIVDSSPKVYMILLHLDKVFVKPGDTFKAGDHIADVGNTGRSFGPHLHYQLQKEPGRTNAIIDPIKFHGTTKWQIPQNELDAFKKSLHKFNEIMGLSK
ncbi:MAG: M23 family metallopeptidase [bacterium]